MKKLVEGIRSLWTLPTRPRTGTAKEVKRRLPRLDWAAECAHLRRVRLENIVPVREPLVLISQVPRSGGTLLSQLLDMHPELHAHPYELFIGCPCKEDWPVIRLEDGPAKWFETLYEEPAFRAFFHGYSKQRHAEEEERDLFPFLFLPSLQKAIFEKVVAEIKPTTVRQVLDCYFTSYFNAWIDNRNFHKDIAKKYVSAFVPRMLMNTANVDQFFHAYPDGRLISIIRDPRGWYLSFRVHRLNKNKSRYAEMDTALSQWIASAEAAIDLKARYGDRMRVLRFDDLLGNTAGVMRDLAAWLGIQFTDSLLVPTFNGFPIRANSSFKVQGYGVSQEPVERWKKHLTADEIAYIEQKTDDLFHRAQELACRPSSAAAA
ncbi:MAG: sulfotransferase [Gemmatales bacterium]|nr:sulfotransferase [Gemmatales bacterium]MDW8385631.1 sulfotransferase [Gemmatales bacterium]